MNEQYLVIMVGRTLVFLFHKEMKYLRKFFEDQFTKPEEMMEYCAAHDIHVYLKTPSCWLNIPEVFDYVMTCMLINHCKNTKFSIEELEGLIMSLHDGEAELSAT